MSFVLRRDRREGEGRWGRKYLPPIRNLSGCMRKNRTRILIMIWLLGSSLAVPLSLNAEQRKGLGMWVWLSSSFSTLEARQQLVTFCVKNHITHLDVHVTMKHGSIEPVLKDPEAFKDLIALAGQHNITTAALRGNPKMFFSENHERTLRELRAVIAFGKSLPQKTQFKGIKYDVEPYCTQKWKAAGRMLVYPIIHDYLALLRKARTVLEEGAPHLRLAVDTPFWWDKGDLALEFEGKTKPFNEHVQDLTDYITIMSYRRSPRQVLDCVENERRYAQQIKKFIMPSLETVKLKQYPHVSFWGLPKEALWKTVPILLEASRRDPAIGGVMLHCYRSLFEILNNEFPH